ncbi:LysR family transcriptional regulator [Sphingobium sp. DC-2]|uniref:LysR family transcriptional regulator n=1 Tax=Sphingobium sp. DC-2 TaxID=1303256 RepID=UPI0004C2D7ED|nr:LysR family transcriptional regulator [Sphingobium sp. DC-2]
MHSTRLDLNLLKLLPALRETRSVSQAAAKLGLSQPGFSSALARLRRQLDDQLFVRTATGMQPTPLAIRLIEGVSHVISTLEGDLATEAEFNPSMLEAPFRIALSDAGEPTIVPPLLDRIVAAAPQSGLIVDAPDPQELTAVLEAGEIELAIGFYPELRKSTFKRQKLFDTGFTCVAAAGHPAMKEGRISTDAYFHYGHIRIIRAGRSEVALTRFLKKRGYSRRTVLSTPHFLGLPYALNSSDLLATLPSVLADELGERYGLQTAPLPLDVPGFAVSQYWHVRYDRHPRNRWIRRQLAELFLGRG